MQRYLFSRLIQSLLLMFGVLVIVFFMVRLTGDPASLLINRDFASPEQMAAMRAALGLDKPTHLQFVDYLLNLLTGDFGYSLRFRQPALEVNRVLPPVARLTPDQCPEFGAHTRGDDRLQLVHVHVNQFGLGWCGALHRLNLPRLKVVLV